MADIELITDGIAREIIEANKENHNELIESISHITNYGRFVAESKGVVKILRNNASVSGKGYVLDMHIFKATELFAQKVTIDGNVFFSLNKFSTPEGSALNIQDMWIPFNEGVEVYVERESMTDVVVTVLLV